MKDGFADVFYKTGLGNRASDVASIIQNSKKIFSSIINEYSDHNTRLNDEESLDYTAQMNDEIISKQTLYDAYQTVEKIDSQDYNNTWLPFDSELSKKVRFEEDSEPESKKVRNEAFEAAVKARREQLAEERAEKERLAAEQKAKEAAERAERIAAERAEKERQEAERLASIKKEQERLAAERAAKLARRFSPYQEARLRELVAQFPELGDKNIRILFGVIADSKAAGTTDKTIYRNLVKKYHPDTAAPERKQVHGLVIGLLGHLYDNKTKTFSLF